MKLMTDIMYLTYININIIAVIISGVMILQHHNNQDTVDHNYMSILYSKTIKLYYHLVTIIIIIILF